MCKNCGLPILVSIFRGGDWCSDDCRKVLVKRDEMEKNYLETRKGWTDGVESFDNRFPTMGRFIERFGEDALLTTN